MTKPFETNGMRYGTGPNGERVCRGARMGRSRVVSAAPEALSTPITVERVPLEDGYDPGGAYWGTLDGKSLYCAYSRDQKLVLWIWAESVGHAIARAVEQAEDEGYAVTAIPAN